MKRIFAFGVTAAMALLLAACSGPVQGSGNSLPSSSTPSSSVSNQPASVSPDKAEQSSEPNSSFPETVSQPSKTEDPPAEPESQSSRSSETEAPSSSAESEAAGELEMTESKALVVYFSHSGNTKSVADSIASQTGADTFRIEPVEAYTTDYNTLLDVAKGEQSAQARPAISGSIDNLEEYSVVYLGYPNWWGDMPMILYTFLDTYDLSGKTVAPFVTSGGSGLSGTVGTIRSLEPGATVTDGLAVRDSAAADPDSAVAGWLESLGLAG